VSELNVTDASDSHSQKQRSRITSSEEEIQKCLDLQSMASTTRAPQMHAQIPRKQAWINDAWFKLNADAISFTTFERVGPCPVAVLMSVQERQVFLC
jgi:hypothetical protein